MNFDEFAKRIGRVLLEGEKTTTFVRNLFESILPEEDYYLLNKSRTSFKAYYNGRASINSLARKINAHTNVRLFEDFIEESGKTAVRKLCEAFLDVMPDIREKNAGKKLAVLFDQIITEAAAIPPKQSKKNLTENQTCDIHSEKINKNQEGKNMSEKDQKVAKAFEGLKDKNGTTYIYNEVTMNNSGTAPQIKENSGSIIINVNTTPANAASSNSDK